MNAIIIREIQKADNVAIAKVIRDVLIEHNVPKVGTVYADPSLNSMFEKYSEEKSAYFVVEKEGQLIGGAGIAPLENGPKEICELQKMYFLSKARGLGLGAKLMEVCLEKARQFEFKKCYLETMPYMTNAQNLYKKSGFQYLDKPLGNTGHNACPVWMLKEL